MDIITAREDEQVYDGTEGQDRKSYSDSQDRENYTVDDDDTGTFRGSVTKVEKSIWTTPDERPLYKHTISDEKGLSAVGFECSVTLFAPLPFGAAYDVTIAPAPRE